MTLVFISYLTILRNSTNVQAEGIGAGIDLEEKVAQDKSCTKAKKVEKKTGDRSDSKESSFELSSDVLRSSSPEKVASPSQVLVGRNMNLPEQGETAIEPVDENVSTGSSSRGLKRPFDSVNSGN